MSYEELFSFTGSIMKKWYLGPNQGQLGGKSSWRENRDNLLCPFRVEKTKYEYHA